MASLRQIPTAAPKRGVGAVPLLAAEGHGGRLLRSAIAPIASASFSCRLRGHAMPSISSSRALATAVWPRGVNRAAKAVVLVLVGTAILAISAKIKVPFWPVPMTLQTLAVLLIGAAYGSRLAVATVVAYIAEGMLGLPVFTNTPPAVAGPLYMLGPTAGFIMSWVLVAAIVGFATDRGWDRSAAPPRRGDARRRRRAVRHGLRLARLVRRSFRSGAAGIGAAKAFAAGVAPFLLGDALKVVLAALLIPASWSLVDQRPRLSGLLPQRLHQLGVEAAEQARRRLSRSFGRQSAI